MRRLIFIFVSLGILYGQGRDTILFYDLFDRDTLGAKWVTYGTPNAYPWWGVDTNIAYNSFGSLADSPFRSWTKDAWSWAAMSYGMNFADLLTAYLSFYQKREMQSNRGWGYVEVSTDGGENWISLATYQGNTGWEQSFVSLNNYVNLPDVRIRFFLLVAGNANPNLDGWFIDSVVIIGTKRLVCDVGAFRVVAPGDTIRRDTTLIPQVQVVSYGNTQDTFPTWLAIFYKGRQIYEDSAWTTLEGGGSAILNFDPFSPESLGVYNIISWTVLNGDTFYYNDTLKDSTWVISYTHDVGTEEILSPIGSRYPGRVRLQAVFKNYGLNTEEFYAYFRITKGLDTILKRSTPLLLLPDSTKEVDFGDTMLAAGSYKVIAWTYLANDEKPDNNLKEESLYVLQFDHDVGVDRIISPPTTNNFDTLTPRILVYNLGLSTETFTAYFKISDFTGEEFYQDSTMVQSLPPDSVREITFSRWMPNKIGRFFARCSLYLAGDQNSSNDTLTKYFTVLIGGWLRRADIPLGPKKKGVSSGGCLTFIPDSFVYALKGNNTNEFYRYNIIQNRWDALCSIPYAPLKKKGVKGGAALCSDGRERVFALKGNKTDEFWCYFPRGDSWHLLKPVPPIPKSGVKDGAGICYITKGDSDFVFLLKGTKSFFFSAYYIQGDTWMKRADAPAGQLMKKWGKGSCLTTDGANIYALKGGGKYNEFYVYNTLTDTWVERCSLPLIWTIGKKKKVKDGASLCYDPQTDRLYAFKGGNTDEFWSYSIARNKWEERDPLPLSTSGKRVKAGGSLVFTDFLIFALKGNKTIEFWMFIPIETTGFYHRLSHSPQTTKDASYLKIGQISVSPNPCREIVNIFYYPPSSEPWVSNGTITLYNSFGKRVKELKLNTSHFRNGISLSLRELPAGAYFIFLRQKDRSVWVKVTKL